MFVGKGFTLAGSLTGHRRTHAGEKPYDCDVCKRHYTRKHVLMKHKTLNIYWRKDVILKVVISNT